MNESIHFLLNTGSNVPSSHLSEHQSVILLTVQNSSEPVENLRLSPLFSYVLFRLSQLLPRISAKRKTLFKATCRLNARCFDSGNHPRHHKGIAVRWRSIHERFSFMYSACFLFPQNLLFIQASFFRGVLINPLQYTQTKKHPKLSCEVSSVSSHLFLTDQNPFAEETLHAEDSQA